MKTPLHTLANGVVAAARIFTASVYGATALGLGLFMLWLTVTLGMDWFILAVDGLIGFYAAGYIRKAWEAYATGQQPERAGERQRYLESRMLHNPERRERPGRSSRADRQ